jgi:hypothetical protein
MLELFVPDNNLIYVEELISNDGTVYRGQVRADDKRTKQGYGL